MSKIKIGIIGAGGIVKSRHIPGFSKLKDVEIFGVCNRTKESSQKFVKEYNIPKVYSSPEELIDSSDINSVLIGTWPYRHCEYTIKSLQAKKHVFVQARMCMDKQEANLMLQESIKNSNLATMICPSPFGFDADLELRKLLQINYIGEPITVRYVNLNNYNADSVLTWRNQMEYSGLNIMGMGIFYETISRWVTHAKDVFATGKINVKNRKNSNGQMESVDIIDNLIISGTLKNGATYNYQFGNVLHPSEHVIEIFGTKGTIKYDFDKKLLLTAKGNTPLKQSHIPIASQKKWEVEDHFVDHILNGTQHETSFSEGYQYMAFTQAIHDSISRNEKVIVN